jgi:hypothetical protein
MRSDSQAMRWIGNKSWQMIKPRLYGRMPEGAQVSLSQAKENKELWQSKSLTFAM